MAPPSDGDKPAISIDSLAFIIHSVFLPPKLPQRDDSAPESDQALITVLLQSLKKFHATGNHVKANETVVPLMKMLENTTLSRAPNGGLLQSEVEKQLGSMKDLGMLQSTSISLGLPANHKSQTYYFSTSKLRTLHFLFVAKVKSTLLRHLRSLVPTLSL